MLTTHARSVQRWPPRKRRGGGVVRHPEGPFHAAMYQRVRIYPPPPQTHIHSSICPMKNLLPLPHPPFTKQKCPIQFSLYIVSTFCLRKVSSKSVFFLLFSCVRSFVSCMCFKVCGFSRRAATPSLPSCPPSPAGLGLGWFRSSGCRVAMTTSSSERCVPGS